MADSIMSIPKIVHDLQKLIRRMKDAPKEMEDFKFKSITFCDALRMLEATYRRYGQKIGEQVRQLIGHIDRLLRQSQILVKSIQRILHELKGLEKDALSKPWKVLWKKLMWGLNDHPVARLENGMILAYSAINAFVAMLSIHMEMDRLESPDCTPKEKQRLEQVMCVQQTLLLIQQY